METTTYQLDRLSEFLRQIQTLERTGTRGAVGSPRTILEGLQLISGCMRGALYLREGKEEISRLAIKSDSFEAPAELISPSEELDGEAAGSLEGFSPRPWLAVPLTFGREIQGWVILASPAVGSTTDDREAVRIAASYAGSVVAIHRISSEVKESEFGLRYRIWELESLYDIGLSIASTLHLDQLGDEILTHSIALLNGRRAALHLKQRDGQFRLLRSIGSVKSDFFEEHFEGTCARDLTCNAVPIRFAESTECIFPDCASFIALPIQNAGEVIGVLSVADRETRDGGIGPFEENDIKLLSQFANQVAIALENARLHREALDKQAIERDLELAATIQSNILPRGNPVEEGFSIATLSRPARQLGGDYYAFFQEPGKISFCVADVAGKSVPAAILVSALHAALQLLFDEGRELGDIATELNRHIHRWSSDTKFITCIIVTVDRARREIRYVNAGHNPGYLVEGNRVHHLASHGLPIGLMPGVRYTTQTRSLPPGSLIALYSDGITEAENTSDEEFGYERLQDVLVANASAPVEVIRDELLKAVEAFVGDAPQGDDQTVVMTRVD
ncbi:MAG TPA: SpoIIE family protein phosphatase [Thermoanaerobaculia bacterium]|nr:SpoIIE family protein phosphatase [Thermoanaerobaculia bacterium]